MNNIILRYLIDGFLKNFLKVILFFFCFGIILNLFEEIEFFKNLDVSIFVPFITYTAFYSKHYNSTTSFYNICN